MAESAIFVHALSLPRNPSGDGERREWGSTGQGIGEGKGAERKAGRQA